ncbi:hypothetical protein CDAR_556141 [Caerostris darwini]|uniref:Uncharacterized protein n=1 Tax=Caerostris darwini TaxID=1538125 RepID=A0AAV4SQA7_9ARAC|nr:hypothetical protein CDAR_556141 [Caerostris darwini]
MIQKSSQEDIPNSLPDETSTSQLLREGKVCQWQVSDCLVGRTHEELRDWRDTGLLQVSCHSALFGATGHYWESPLPR